MINSFIESTINFILVILALGIAIIILHLMFAIALKCVNKVLNK